jgi:hypothetical protein
MDQLMTLVGTFIYSDGSTHPTASSSMVMQGTAFPLGTDYLWGIIADKTGFGSPDYLPVFSGSFINSGKTARGGFANDLGEVKYKYAYGFSRQMKRTLNQPVLDNTREEWVRFNFFVTEAIDNTQISNSIGFTNSGISAIGGDGFVGRDKEEYVTFSVLTHAFLTQENMEILTAGISKVHLTQVNFEMLWIPPSYCRNTQTVEEVLYLANLAAIEQTAVETMANSTSASRHALLDQVAIEMIHTIRAAVLFTQQTLEAFQGPGNPSVLMTQNVMEILTLNQLVQYAAANIQQVAIATAHNGSPNGIVEQIAIEDLFNNAGNSRLEQVALEAVTNGNSDAVIQQVAVAEVNNSTTFHGCVQQVAIEMLIKPEFDPTVSSLIVNPKYHI